MEQKFYQVINSIKKLWFVVIWLVLMLLSYLFIDKSLALWMHTAVGPTVASTFQMVTRLGYGWYYIIAFSLLFMLGKFGLNNRKLAIAAFFLLLAVLVPGILCDILKVIFGRARPVELFQHHLFGFYFWQLKASMLSFPSGHATTITGVMVALSFLWPRYWLGFFAIFVLVSVSRVVITTHFLSDVMGGMYLGSITVIGMQHYFYRYFPEVFSYKICKKEAITIIQ